MTFVEQVWGTTNEKIHSVGTACLGMSVLAFLVLRTDVKSQALVIFTSFASGVTLIGLATVRNSWRRWRTGEDTLILLRRRSMNYPVRQAAIHVFGWRIQWAGRVAHVDVGTFEVRRIVATDSVGEQSLPSRGYQLFRASYWMACSSILFQSVFGLAAVGYGLWLLDFLLIYSRSKI